MNDGMKPLGDRMESEIMSPPVDEVRAKDARILALEHGQQDAINAALEGVAQHYQEVGERHLHAFNAHVASRPTSFDAIYFGVAEYIRSRINSNPLAEALARIAELEGPQSMTSPIEALQRILNEMHNAFSVIERNKAARLQVELDRIKSEIMPLPVRDGAKHERAQATCNQGPGTDAR